MKNKTCHIRVSGLVQGVAFRHYTKLQADRTGITGWVRNRPDGTVESMISGTEKQIEEMVAWLHVGPPAARVSEVTVIELQDADPYSAFDILY